MLECKQRSCPHEIRLPDSSHIRYNNSGPLFASVLAVIRELLRLRGFLEPRIRCDDGCAEKPVGGLVADKDLFVGIPAQSFA
jgi:hypothetical protein